MFTTCVWSQHLYNAEFIIHPHGLINQVESVNVTGPAKTGHVGTNYTPSLYRSYLSTGIVYLHSVTFIMMPGKCLLRAENCNAIA